METGVGGERVTKQQQARSRRKVLIDTNIKKQCNKKRRLKM